MDDHTTGRSTAYKLGERLRGVVPAPRPYFAELLPYHQPVSVADVVLFLHRTAGQPGHTFTKG